LSAAATVAPSSLEAEALAEKICPARIRPVDPMIRAEISTAAWTDPPRSLPSTSDDIAKASTHEARQTPRAN